MHHMAWTTVPAELSSLTFTLMDSRRHALVFYIRMAGRDSTGFLARMNTDGERCATEDWLRQSYEEDFHNSLLLLGDNLHPQGLSTWYEYSKLWARCGSSIICSPFKLPSER